MQQDFILIFAAQTSRSLGKYLVFFLYFSRESSSGSSGNPDLFSDLHTTLETCSDVSNPSSKNNTEKRSRSSRHKAPQSIFKFQLLPGKYIKIAFDRLALLALFDRYCSYTYEQWSPLSFTIHLEIMLLYHVSQQIVINNMADFGQIYVILMSQFPYFHAEHH